MPSYHILATQTLGDICAWEGGKGQWWMKAHGQRVEGKNKQTKTNKILTVKEDCGEMWPLDDNVAVEEEVGQAYLYIFIFFLKEAMQSQYQTWHWMISQTSQKCKVHSKTSTSRLTSQTAGTLKEATARGLADAVYLLWATFRKRHLTEPVPSGGLWLRRAGGHLPDPTARGVVGGGGGGGKGRRGQGGSGRITRGGRTSRDKGTAPLAIRAVPGVAISIREQGPVDS